MYLSSINRSSCWRCLGVNYLQNFLGMELPDTFTKCDAYVYGIETKGLAFHIRYYGNPTTL